MAGYSGTPLPKKLGISPGARLRFVAAPNEFAAALGPLPAGVRFAARGPADVVVFFTERRADLDRRFARLARGLDRAGGLWIAWPKKASGVPTDLDECSTQATLKPRPVRVPDAADPSGLLGAHPAG